MPVIDGAVETPAEAWESVAVLPTERLEAEITTLAGQLAAGECRWLMLVGELDRRDAWKAWGCASIVHWLGWQCGLDARAARERVRVARALREFSAVRDAFAVGLLTYSKVRAITRVMTAETEPMLVEMACHATAAQIERICAAYRKTVDPTRHDQTNRAHERRRVDLFHDPDGFAARLRTTHDDGARFRGALAQVVDASIEARPLAPGETFAQRRADVLVDTVVAAAQHGTGGARTASPGDRHLVVVHVDATVLSDDAGTVCELDEGPGIAAETARRLACDARIVGLVRDADRTITGIGRASRRPPRWLRRRLHARDRGCRYPGCGERRIVVAHHVQHWGRGGPTDLANLVELCAAHHRLVHEGGWTLAVDTSTGAATFAAPDGRVVTEPARGSAGAHRRSGSAEPLRVTEPLERANARRGVAVTATTAMPPRHDRLDLDLAVTALLPPHRGEPHRRS